jgi:hypothetical protein
MADITDPIAVDFVKDRLRRRAETIRALLALMDDDKALWNQISGLIANTADDTIIDGIDDAQGLTGADVHTFMARVDQLRGVLNADFAMDIVHKACVRDLEVTL